MSGQAIQPEISLPQEYVLLMLDQLAKSGVEVDAWLEGHLGPLDAIDDLGGLLDFPTVERLVLDAMAEAREPALGLFVGARLVTSTHGIVGAAAINSRTVGQALDITERFSRLRSSPFNISHEIDGDSVRASFTEVLPLGGIQRPLLEAVMLSIKSGLDEITMGAGQLDEVAFPFEAPEYAALASDMFGCPVRYGEAWAGFSAPAAILELPLKLADPAAFDEAAKICQHELDLIAAQESTSARVRRLLLESQNGFPSLQVIARLCHMTPRTLHRRLVAEGTSFRALLESVRHALALAHLSSRHFTMEDVAYRLGYTDIANFRRAFKRWEGIAPSTYRERAGATPGSG